MKTRVLMLGTNAGDANIFVRCLREVAHKYEVTILLEPQQIPHVMTNFGRFAVIPVREISADCLFEYLNKNAQSHDILLPSGFGSVKLISAHVERLSHLIRIVSLPDAALIEELDDKLTFAHYCTTHEMPHPVTIGGTDFFANMPHGMTFPLLLKHRLGAGKQGIRLVHSPEDACAGSESKVAEEFIAQEYLSGSDFAFNGFCRDGAIISWSIQRFHSVKILGRDRLRISTFVKNDAIYDLAKKLITMAGYCGPINIDFRYVSATDRYYFIEVNPRFWANTHYSLIDGVNFIDVALDAGIAAGSVQPQHSGKAWGEPTKTFVLMICFFRYGLLRFLLSQSALQLKIELIDNLDRLYSRYIAGRIRPTDK
ncbi:MAG: ATP-grasp domain-containing protein [Desulfuromonadaceae bacterium]|nr:ATP-grasp domain-containing protein [Desulfuromonadaceae bacterium]